jgi:hypothetical protein
MHVDAPVPVQLRFVRPQMRCGCLTSTDRSHALAMSVGCRTVRSIAGTWLCQSGHPLRHPLLQSIKLSQQLGMLRPRAARYGTITVVVLFIGVFFLCGLCVIGVKCCHYRHLGSQTILLLSCLERSSKIARCDL